VIRKIPIKTLLIVGLLICGIIPTLVVTFVSYRTTRNEMKSQVFRQLESVRNIKKEQIANFFKERIANISSFSENPTVIKSYEELKAVFDQEGGLYEGHSNENFVAPPSYMRVHERYFHFLKNLTSLYGYYDLFLLDPVSGDTIFTLRKEADFGVRMSEISSSLRDVWIEAVKEKRISLSDTRSYPPSNNIPAQFLAAPILENNEVIGVIAVQISIDSIDDIMKERSGMWETGETYLVGQDKKMRSDSYLDGHRHSVLASFRGTVEENGVDTDASREALRGIEDKRIIVDYRGKRVLSAYTPIVLKDVKWALIAEVDEEEVNRQIARALNTNIILLTGLSVFILLLLALTISTFIDRGIRNVLFQLEKVLDDILRGKVHARVDPGSVGVDFQRVMARTNELLNAFVKQMKERKKLEEQIQGSQRLEAIGTLAGGIAHDFNNILTSMHAYALIIKNSTPKNSVAEENIDELVLSIRRASELVEQILTFSRQVKTEDVFLDISEEIRDSIKLFKAALPRNILVESHLSSERLLIKANPSQISQVIMNLYTNAYQAMQRKGGTLTISTDKVTLEDKAVSGLKSGVYCKIHVRDTGHGMDREILDRIFEPFFTTKPVGEGTGMGLSVVYGIVRRCGGAIEVKSFPGKGTCFDVYFPWAQKAGFQERKQDREISLSKGKGHILFVDDDAQICDSQKKALELIGYSVTAIQDSRAAEEAFSKNPDQFDVLILDLNMPQLSGFELAERIFKIRSNIPAILTTGFAELIDPKKVDESGFHAVLLKPYRIDDISSLIAEILKSEQENRH
jgi:signal transduction histidine kinase/ActR/RegA family two-component response regulator